MASTLLKPSDILFVSDQQPLTLAVVNGILNQFIQAINGVLVRMDGYDGAVQNLVNLGLANINSTLGPFLITLQQAAQLGFLVAEADGVSLSLSVGNPFDCVMTSNGASLFTPTKWLMAIDVNDSTNWGVLQLVSWVQGDLNLSTNCIYASKTQASSSWQITCGSGVLNAMVNDLNSANAAATNAATSANNAAANAATVAGALGAISSGPVVSVAGRSGIVTLGESDIAGLSADLTARPTTTYVNNAVAGLQPHSATLDSLAALVLSSFMLAFLGNSSATTALSSLGGAPLLSPVLTGAPKAPTPTAGDSSTNIATTAFVAANFVTPAALAAATINSGQVAAQDADFSTSITLDPVNDKGKIKNCTSASAVTVTVPSTVAKDFYCTLHQAAAGQITVAAGSGAIANSYNNQFRSAGQYAMVTIYASAAGVVTVAGNTTP